MITVWNQKWRDGGRVGTSIDSRLGRGSYRNISLRAVLEPVPRTVDDKRLNIDYRFLKHFYHGSWENIVGKSRGSRVLELREDVVYSSG